MKEHGVYGQAIVPAHAAVSGLTPYPGPFGWVLDMMRLLSSWREEFFDIIFYDTDNLSQHEVEKTAWLYNLKTREGDFFAVRPTASGGGVEPMSIEELVERFQEQDIALAVPGVASSAIGAVSFARSVADGLQKPTVAIVAGLGWNDLFPEAIGGAFANTWAKVVRQLPLPMPMLEIDAERLLKILRTPLKVDTIVGHSKGNVIILNTLRRLAETEQNARRDLRVITFGCMVMPPPWLTRIDQYMGTFDPLGFANTSIVFWWSPYQHLRRWFSVFGSGQAIDVLSPEHVHWLPYHGHRIGSNRAAVGNELTPFRRALSTFSISESVDVEALLRRQAA